MLVSGGLGLVGVNYADHRLYAGDSVVVLDNRSRGTSNDLNFTWLQTRHPRDPLRFVFGSVADPEAVHAAGSEFNGVDLVVHCAAQSSVDRSMAQPAVDFTSNVIGTFTVLEYLRTQCPEAVFVFMASNKVYDVTAWATELRGTSHRFAGRTVGPSERFPFHTDAKEPYGASKICGLYYTRCYAAMYGMPAIVVVPSGMYGPRQFGKEEQGWMGWMCIAAELGLTFTIKGDGFQCRDMLHVSDVNRALDLLIDKAPQYKGEMFNLGGGPRNAVSLIEALSDVALHLRKTPHVDYADWRPQDNKCYISNIERMIGLGWVPKMSIKDGIADMCRWVSDEHETLEQLYNKEMSHAT